MQAVAASVKQFMTFSHPDAIASTPTIPDAAHLELCKKLLKEEIVEELFPAIASEDIVEIGDAIADSIYVLLFTAHCFGLPIASIWREVVQTNLDKFPDGVVTRDPQTHKVLKPPGWKPPDIEAVIANAALHEPMYCPACGKRHYDAGTFAVHRAHRCVTDAAGTGCGREWIVLPFTFGV
jgi:predicted HAD superfamily Cof-like phosphohydrolase